MNSIRIAAVSLVALGWATSVQAQDVAQAADAASETGEEDLAAPGTIIVSGERIRGQLIVDQPPVAEYDSEDISAFGGSSIADIIAAIEPSTGGARGSRGGGGPVFLINGIRVSSPREFRSYPPESIAKIEVFAEEVAQRFGYDPDQRVVNIVLKNDYAAITLEGELEAPARGGYWRNEEEATYLRIADGARLNFNLDVEDTSLLTEAERGFTVPSSIPGVADEAPFRSLVSDSWQVEGTANYARAFIDSGSSLSLNATASRAESTGLSGLRDTGSAIEPIERRSRTDTLSLGAAYNRSIGSWKATFTSDAVLANGDTEIDRRNAAGFDTAETRTRTVVNKATFTGYPVELPAGEVSATLDLGFDWKRLESSDTRSATDASITRRRFDGGINLNIPIARRGEAWGAIGTASLNLSAGAEDLSDFGSLANWTAGLNWSPVEKLNLQVTRIWREAAPGISALGNPRIDEFNVPVFDFATGQDVLATVTTGGNPNLGAETQSDWKLGANWELPIDGMRLQVDYGINRSRDVTLSSPAFTAAFEQAFPERVTRDAGGGLLAIDRRPVTLYETRSRTLSFGLSMRGRIGGSDESGGGRSGGSRGGPQGGFGGGGGESQQPRFDPERFAQLREQFCAAPASDTPDLSQLPEGMRARLVDADGNPDPVRVEMLRQRLCSADGEADVGRFAALREALCAEPPRIDELPPQMLERLRGEDGEIDQERLGQFRTRMCAADGAGGPPRGEGGLRGGGAGMNPFARRGGGGGGRYFVNLNHTIALQNEVTLAEGGPVFDQLDGYVLGSGAIPRNSTRLEGGMFMNGYGARLSGNYLGEAVLRGSGLPGSSDLFFGDLVTFDLRLFADLGEILKREEGFLKGFRVAFVVDNIFDGQRRVVDANGDVPVAYDPRRIDPVGRYLGIDLRKMF
ncbi:hypothetical protein [Qipengyuania mesophila]|uniref:hypothetical protein n=1 Tax=Qipengyuania mesophila TaxID=2867246 RepID=UPI0035199A00